MINFVAVNGQPQFEANDELIKKSGMSVNELFLSLAIKTKEDWEKLFVVTDADLTVQKETVKQQQIQIELQKQEILKQKSLLDSLDKLLRIPFFRNAQLAVFNHFLGADSEHPAENHFFRVLGNVDESAGTCNAFAESADINIAISIRLSQQAQEQIDEFEKAVAGWTEVTECYLMTGSRDYLLHVYVDGIEGYERFLKQKLTRLEGIASIESSFALEQVKYTNVLPVE